jgi:hypothetical protein
MEVLLTTVLLETVLLHTATALERRRRNNFMIKWAKGEMTMKELLWLKRQPWFQRAFESVDVEPEKKEN